MAGLMCPCTAIHGQYRACGTLAVQGQYSGVCGGAVEVLQVRYSGIDACVTKFGGLWRVLYPLGPGPPLPAVALGRLLLPSKVAVSV
jgi:hypothetical protein